VSQRFDNATHNMSENNNSTLAATPFLLTPEQAADYLQITTRTLRNLVVRGLIPQTKLTGKLVRYRKPDLDASLGRLTTGLHHGGARK
jgi:excisionase family DNA binding protein